MENDIVKEICSVFGVEQPVKKVFRVVIAGTRTFCNYGLLETKLDILLKNKKEDCEIVIVSGCARGADTLGERYAFERGYRVDRYPADWSRHGKAAGYIRNKKMAENAESVVIFWDGISKGSMHMRDIALKMLLPVRVVNYQLPR